MSGTVTNSHRARLILNGTEAELDAKSWMLFTFTAEDLTAPSAVKNSWSKTVTLPATVTNKKIFQGLGNIQRRDFTAGKKLPFVLVSYTGDLLERGYFKVSGVNIKDGNIESYSVNLYGELGAILQCLETQGDTGNDLTLGDLQWFDDDDKELDITLNATTIADFWEKLGNWTVLPTYETPPTEDWQIINFAPCYNGYPDNFDTDKMLINVDNMELTTKDTDGDKTYSTYNGLSVADLVTDITEWEAQDLRAYLQRPVVSVMAFLHAVRRWIKAEHGADFDFSGFAQPNNGRGLWISLQLPDRDNILGYDDADETTMSFRGTINSTYQLGNTDVSKNDFQYHPTSHKDAVTFLPMRPGTMTAKTESLTVLIKLGLQEGPLLPTGTSGNISFNSGFAYAVRVTYNNGSTADMGFLVTSEQSIISSHYTEVYKYLNFVSTNITTSMGAKTFTGGEFFSIGDISSLINDSYFIVSVQTIGFPFSVTYASGDYVATYIDGKDATLYTDAKGNTGRYGLFNTQVQFTGMYEGRVTTPYSNRMISQFDLLNTGVTPLTMLTGLCKMFGYALKYDNKTETLSMIARDGLYSDTEVVDIDDNVDLSQTVKITPYVYESQFAELALEDGDGEYIEKYNTKNAVPFGTQNIQTNYEFDTEKTNFLDGVPFRAAATVMERSSLFYTLEKNGGFISPVFAYNGNTYKLYTEDLEDEEDLNISKDGTKTFLNTDFQYYDIFPFPKPQFHDGDNGATDGDLVVLVLNNKMISSPVSGWTFKVTDDAEEMYLLNNDKPCWIDRSVYTGMDVNYLPIFSTFTFSYSSVLPTSSSILDNAHIQTDLLPATPTAQALVGDWRIGSETGLYECRYQSYMRDRLFSTTIKAEVKVRLTGLVTNARDFLCRFVRWRGAIWVVNEIKDWDAEGFGECTLTLILVNDISNYSSGQKQIN